MEVPSVRERTLAYVVLGLAIWSAALWGFWISQPLKDEVDVVVVERVEPRAADQASSAEPELLRKVTATCGTPWQATAGPVPPVPQLVDGERFAHAPCRRLHRDNRIVLGMNAAVVLGGLGAVVVLAPRRIRKTPTSDEVPVPASSTIS